MAYKKFSTTKATALSSAMTSGDTSVFLVDGSTYPDPAVGGNGPYTVIIGYGSDREEICTVTAKPNTNTLTVTRGEDGSTAVAKNIGDVVVHGVSKRDWDDLLAKAGGTMTGAIVLAGAPTVDLNPATKKYVDDADALKAPLASPTFTGTVGLPTTSLTGPLNLSNGAAVKWLGANRQIYADDAIDVLYVLNTTNGDRATLQVASPVESYDAATKVYVDGLIKRGSASITSDGSGYFTIAHGLGATPGACLAMALTGSAVWANVTGWDGTNISGRLLSPAGGGTSVNNYSVSVAWIAVR